MQEVESREQASPPEGQKDNIKNEDKPQQHAASQQRPPYYQPQPSQPLLHSTQPPHPPNLQHMNLPRPPPMPFPISGMGPPPRPFGMGVPMMPPPLMMGLAPMPVPYLTAPVLSTPAPIVVPAPPLKQPLCTEPNNTIRVSNLKEKIAIEDLKKALMKIFSKYGEILDIVAQKGLRMKGQAFIIYKDLSSAEKAVKETNGTPIFNRIMVVQFSRNRSDKTAERMGQLEENKRERHERFLKRMENRQTRAPKPKTRNASGSGYRPIPDHMIINKILFLQHLPAEIDEQTLVLLFKQYPGFKEVRLVPGRSDIAFVEYDTEHQASMAKTTLNNYPVLPDHPMKITFAKR